MTEKFYKMTLPERHEFLLHNSSLTEDDLKAWLPGSGLSHETADHMIENAVGVFSLPLGIAQNFIVNGRSVLVPMVVEEPSVVAAVSYMAKLAQTTGGFKAWMSSQEMIGQVQLLDLADIDAAQNLIETHKLDLLQQAGALNPGLTRHGGGLRDLEVRRIDDSPIGPFLVLHLILDVADAMGANMVNTACEALAPLVEEMTGGRVNLRILSNLADRRLARARCVVPAQELETEGLPGEVVAQRIVEAYALAAVDPYRAATHNKGIMNGVDAVVMATGNDWRAIEAGAHAYAARDGLYRSLSTWSYTPGDPTTGARPALVGNLEMPLAVGTVGGATRVHPLARFALQVMQVKNARELAEIIVSVGLAQNLAAIRALATEGIQRGHMALHARQIAIAAGARPDEVDRVAAMLVTEKQVRADRAREILAALRENLAAKI